MPRLARRLRAVGPHGDSESRRGGARRGLGGRLVSHDFALRMEELTRGTWASYYVRMQKLPIIALAFLAVVSTAAAQTYTSALVGARRHRIGLLAGELPYAQNDYSGVAAVRFHDRDAWWQAGVGYAWDPSGNESADYVLTPQAHLFFKGNLLLIGVGVLKSYVRDDTRKDKWSPVYYELAAGIEVPVGRAGVTFLANHPFRNWSDAGNVRERRIEYSVGLSLRF